MKIRCLCVFCFFSTQVDSSSCMISVYCKPLRDWQYEEVCKYPIQFYSIDKGTLHLSDDQQPCKPLHTTLFSVQFSQTLACHIQLYLLHRVDCIFSVCLGTIQKACAYAEDNYLPCATNPFERKTFSRGNNRKIVQFGKEA